MQKNTLWAIVLSMAVMVVWYGFIQPPAPPQQQKTAATTAPAATAPAAPQAAPAVSADRATPEQEIIVETERYRAVLTNRGAAVKHWFLKETDGSVVDLVLPESAPVLTTFPGSNFSVSRPAPRTVVFTYASPLGWRVTKTYDLSDDYLHRVTVATARTKPGAALPALELNWGPGLGTDLKNHKDNTSVTRAIGFPRAKPFSVQKLKSGEFHAAAGLQWAAVDNRYFLAAFILDDPQQLATAAAYREIKKYPIGLSLYAGKPGDAATQSVSARLYLGPKGHEHLKSLGLRLEESIDFGFFGFLGRATLWVLLKLNALLGNYGWAIIVMTVFIQILVLPLTLKSFKASAEMKRLQPIIKDIQEKYKSDPRRLQTEMMNVYKTHHFNPLSGCLPMLLQLPIFWALFTTLQNAYELRGAPWLLWVNDLSAPDTLFMAGSFGFHLLPLIMGVGMFFQQKMMTATSDPMQAKIMYIMPVMFIVMFWGFPSGLVLYWLTNSIVTVIEQLIVMRREPGGAVHG